MAKNKKFYLAILALTLVLASIFAYIRYGNLPNEYLNFSGQEEKVEVEPIHKNIDEKKVEILAVPQKKCEEFDISRVNAYFHLIKNISNLKIKFLQKVSIEEELNFLSRTQDQKFLLELKEYASKNFQQADKNLVNFGDNFIYKFFGKFVKVKKTNDTEEDKAKYLELYKKIDDLYQEILSDDSMNKIIKQKL